MNKEIEEQLHCSSSSPAHRSPTLAPASKHQAPMFDFPKILPKNSASIHAQPDDDRHQHQGQDKRPVGALTESMNTCPLTVSNLSSDGSPEGFSIGSNSSNGSNLCNQPNSNMKSNADDDQLHRHSLVRKARQDSIRHSSTSEASWPAESPDPLSVTARWACRSSPPPSPMRGHMDTLREVAPKDIDGSGRQQLPFHGMKQPSDGETQSQLYQQHELKRKSSSASSSQLSNHSRYLPVRHHYHQNHVNQCNNPKTAEELISSMGGIGLKKKEEVETARHRVRRISRRSTANNTPRNSLSSSSSTQRSSSMKQHRRSSFTVPESALNATIVFVDLEGYSKSSDVHQKHMTCDFIDTLRNLLTFAYGEMPVRGNIDDYVILPTGDGAAVIVIRPPHRTIHKGCNSCQGGWCDDCNLNEKVSQEQNKCDNEEELVPRGIHCQHCSQQSLRTTEETALWIGSSLMLWASHRHIGLRVGLNSGELSIVEDPYGDPNVCGDAINMAARIMDTALPGQILASASSVVPNLNLLMAEEMAAADLLHAYDGDELDGPHHHLDIIKKHEPKSCNRCPRIKYEVAKSASEVVVKHGVTTNVQSITAMLHSLPRPEDLPPEFQPQGSVGLPSTLLTRATTDGTAHSLMKSMRKNPLKQSFASLSSLQPSGNSSSSLRGSLRNLQNLLTRGSKGDLTAERNHSWKLGEAGTSSNKSGGSLRNLQNLLKRGSKGDLTAGRNESWKLGEAGTSSNKSGGGGCNSSWQLGLGSHSGISSTSDNKLGDVRNFSWKLGPGSQSPKSSWKLSESPKHTSALATMTRMSMLSQLSNYSEHQAEDFNMSAKTLATSNSAAVPHHQPLVVAGPASSASAPLDTVPLQHVGNHRTPATKWYMKIKPTEMQSASNNQIKPKVLPQELIRRHGRIAFLGIMHDNLSRGFIKILENDPSHRWDQVIIFFPSDDCLRYNLAKNYDQPVEILIGNKQECVKTLKKLLSPVVHDLRFLQYDQLMHCGSYWDWKDPGGFIHISPVTWGANPKTCPAMNYYWNSKVPSPEYRVYRDGMEFLLDTAKPFEEDEIAEVDQDMFMMDGPVVEEEIAQDPTQ